MVFKTISKQLMAIVFCLLLFSAQKSFAADFSLVCKTDKIEQYINNNIKMYGQPADAATSGTYSNQLNWPTIDGCKVSVLSTQITAVKCFTIWMDFHKNRFGGTKPIEIRSLSS
jgi:hypothetical protein